MAEQLPGPAPINTFRKIPAGDVKPKEDSAAVEKQEKIDVHTEAMNRFKGIAAREEYSRILGIQDLIFIDEDGGTYNEELGFLSGANAKANAGPSTDEPPAPRYQIDRISPVIEEAVSDQRDSQVNIQVRATGEIDSGLDETFNGLIKNIEIVSDAQDAYDGGFDECQKSGYGGWQIVTEYADDSFEQNIFIEPILNATQSLFFGPSKKATKSDALYAFHLLPDMDEEEFKVQYPKAEPIDWKTEGLRGHQLTWFNNDVKTVRLAAYWRKKPVKREILMLTDGRVIDIEDFVEDGSMPIQIGPDGEPMKRKVDSYDVERFIMNGVEVLKGPQKWAGKFIPLIPEYGVRSVINGREIIRGKVRKGKDAQRIYNYTTSAIVETAALSARDFHWATATQVEGHIDELEKMNISGAPIQLYNPDPDPNVPGPPVKGAPPNVQQALIDQRTAAKEDISASVGAGVGIQDGTATDRRSGEAIRQGQALREKGNSIYRANHERAIAYTGLQLADLISRLWTTTRQLRIIKPDNTTDFVTVNETKIIDGEKGGLEEIIINDLTQARFDVVLDIGPAYASQRQQGADQLTELAKENPAFAAHTPDLIAKNLDVPGSDELAKRLRQEGFKNGTITPTDEEREEFGLDEREQLIQELTPQIREEVTNEANIQLITANAKKLNSEAGNLDAAISVKEQEVGQTAAEIEKTLEETENTKLDSLLKAIEANSKLQESMLEKLAVGIQPSQIEVDNLNKQDNIIEDVQQDASPGPSTAIEEEFQELDTNGQ